MKTSSYDDSFVAFMTSDRRCIRCKTPVEGVETEVDRERTGALDGCAVVLIWCILRPCGHYFRQTRPWSG